MVTAESAAAHEAGHMMHLPDVSYIAGSPGYYYAVMKPGWSETNMMAETYKGHDLEASQIEQIIRENM
jgi:hypothetical protein